MASNLHQGTRSSNLGSSSSDTNGWCYELPPLSSESTIGMIEKKSCDETEAFVRREAIAFLSSYHLYKLKRCISSSHARSLYTNLNFFSHTLDIDLDWEVHLHCLKHIAQVIRLVTYDLDKYSTRPRQKSSSSCDQISQAHEQQQQQQNLDDQQNETYYENLNNSNGCADVSSKFSRQLETANSIEVVFVYSECLPTLLKVVSPNSCYDRVVVATAAELLLDLKHNEPLMGVIASNSSSSSSSLDSISIETLEEILAENRLSSDLYTRHPVFILDDVISSYQFDLDEEKAADCY